MPTHRLIFPYRALWEDPQTPHFYDFGIFERVPSSQKQLFVSFETPRRLTKIKTNPRICLKTYYVDKYQNLGNRCFDNIGRDGRRKMMKICLKKLKILGYEINIYQQKTRNGSLVKCYRFISNALKDFLKSRNQETKKPRNQETKHQTTKKPRNQEVKKPRNQKPRSRGTKKPTKTRNEETT